VIASMSGLQPVFFALRHELSPEIGFRLYPSPYITSLAFNESIVHNLPGRKR